MAETEKIIDNVEIQEDETYILSSAATRFLGRITGDKDAQYRLAATDRDSLVSGVMRLRALTQRQKGSLDYEAILTGLFSPDSSIPSITQDIGHTSHRSIYNLLNKLAQRCQDSAPEGISIEELMELGGLEYQPKGKISKIARPMGRAVAMGVALTPPTGHGQRTEDDYPHDEPLAWQADSLCAQVDPELFFPEKGASIVAVKRICDSCEVRNICLRYALENNERYGVWGGLSERQRKKLRNGLGSKALASDNSLGELVAVTS